MSDTRTHPAAEPTLPDEMQDHALEPVPLDRRKPLIQMIIVQIGWNISVSSFLVGGIVGGGTSLGEGLAAILLGNLILVAVSTLVGLVGFRTGLTSYLLSRVVFGRYGSIVVSLLLGVLAMGFIGILMDTWGGAVHRLVPAIPEIAFVLAFAAAITLTAIFGFKGLARFSAVAVPIEVAIALFALVRIGQSAGGFGDLPDYAPKAAIGFSVALGAVVSTWITGAALVGDVARYAIRARDVLISCFFGFVVGAGIFETIATLSAMKVGNSNFVVVMQGLGLLAPAVVMLVLALWNTADNNLYSSSLAFTNASSMVGLRIRKPVWVIIAIVIATAVAFAGFAERFLSFLNIIALVAPPFAAVVIAHFWLLGALRRTGAELTASIPALRVEALAAWVLAAVAAKYTKVLGTDAVEGLVYGLVFYTVLGGLMLLATRSGRRSAAVPAAGDARGA
jgi:cytosine permease